MPEFTLMVSDDHTKVWYEAAPGQIAEMHSFAVALTDNQIASLETPPTFKVYRRLTYRRVASNRARRRIKSWTRKSWWSNSWVDGWTLRDYGQLGPA